MPLAIKFHLPITSIKLLAVGWGLLMVFMVAMFWLLKVTIAYYWLVLALVAIVIAAIINMSFYKNNFKIYQGIYWKDGIWHLLIDNQKTEIQIKANSRVFPYWILLEYKSVPSKSSLKQSLFLPKDCMLDKDYRDLCRTLRFIEHE